MLLKGRQGTELELRIVGYQFPDERFDPWDSNWLLVSIRVVAPQGTWEVVDPSLTTWEARQVVAWLAALAQRPELLAGRGLALSEPNVTFVARAQPVEPDRVLVQACFALELRPPWLKAVAGGANLCVDLDVARRDLAAAAASLHEDLARFPQRGDDPTL